MPDNEEPRLLIGLAREVITLGATRRERLTVRPDRFPDRMRRRQASFVTLTQETGLRGCCGSTIPLDTLVEDLAAHAWRTAFDDPRFSPLRPEELIGMHLEISLLSVLKPVDARSETALLDCLEPGVTGLLISDGTRRATFLPKVWEALPDPKAFVDHLRIKGRFALDHWPAGLRAHIYTTESFGGPLVATD